MDNEVNSIHTVMQLMLVAWIFLVVLVVRRTIRQGSVGLSTALMFTMSFLYGGCFVYAVPNYSHLRVDGHWYLQSYDFSETMIAEATFASLLGILGYALGSGSLRWRANNSLKIKQITFEKCSPGFEKAVLLVLGSVAASSFLLNFLRVSFPLSDAILEVGRNLAVVVVCLGAVLARRKGKSINWWIFVASLIPAYYLFLFGFVSYGFLFGMTILGFWMSQLVQTSRKLLSIKAIILIVLMIYLLLTMFIGWFSFRDEVRLAVWEGSGNLLEVLIRAFANTQFFSLWNLDSLDLVNIRLNLNIFIGKMIANHELFPELREYGATLFILPLAVLPRFIWANKPTRGGSEFMAEHTGMVFSDSATFGTGTVFEFFINFGFLGVFLGFVLIGWFLSRIDHKAAIHLYRSDFLSFARLFVVGIFVIDPLMRPFFMFNGAILAWIVMSVIKFMLSRHKYKPVIAISNKMQANRRFN